MRNPRPLHTRGKHTHTPRLFVGLVDVGNVPPPPVHTDNMREWEALMGEPTYDPTGVNLTYTEREATLVRGPATHTRTPKAPAIRPVRVTTTNRNRK